MRKLIITIFISLIMAMESVDGSKLNNRQLVPVVISISEFPVYGRKNILRQHFFPEFTVKL